MLATKPGRQGPLDDADILPNIIRADHSGHIRTSRSRTDDHESDSELVDSPSGYETESTSPSEGSAGEDMGVRAPPGSQKLKQVRKSNQINALTYSVDLFDEMNQSVKRSVLHGDVLQ